MALRGPEDRLALTREVGRLQMELTCMYTVASKYGMINKMKYFRLHLSDEVGTERPEIDLRLT